ncbi:MAG: enoyl-CoA hydratase [Chloroflexi bacterium]|nr:enoyl-CoA hydratase [Chloroflexota bacterium]
MSEELLVDVDEHGVMLVTLNRPEKMNALSAAISAGLMNALDRASREDDIRAVVITGAGRAFCAGAEIRPDRDPTTGAEGPVPRHARLDHFGGSGRAVEAFAHCDVPILAAINGPTAGAGFGLALCCDIRFVAESARLGPIFMKRGLASDYGVLYWLPKLVGAARAYEIIYDGDLLDARRALEVGIANRVVPDEQLLAETLAYARKVAAGPPLAYTYVRRLVRRSFDLPMHEFLELEWTYQANLLRTHDAREGFAAFVERREPRFRGE